MSRFLQDGLLVLYNSTQVVCWGSVFTFMMLQISQGPEWRNYSLPIVNFSQSLMFLDVVFAILGFSKTNWLLSFMQVFARCYVLFTAFSFAPQTIGIYLSFICWSIAQVIRYSFYLITLFKYEIKLITWLRYNGFIILYPVGVSGEIIGIKNWNNLSKCCPRPFSITMPNTYNFSFDLFYFNVFFLTVYFPCFFMLYNSLLQARSKRIQKLKSS